MRSENEGKGNLNDVNLENLLLENLLLRLGTQHRNYAKSRTGRTAGH